MNTQTERLENHTARITIQVMPERIEKAKQAAARKISRQINIPGFRKGKAPYRIIANYVGEGAILEEAVEELGNEIYREAIDASGVEPFGPGEIEDIKLEETPPVFTFIVPLQPSVELGDYRSVRLPFEAPTVEDEAVDNTIKRLREQHALVEESRQPVASGNNITVDIHGQLIVDEVDAEEAVEAETVPADAENADEDHDEHADEEPHHHHVDENTIIHQHGAVMSLTEENEPVPGFIAALSGAAVGETREFELTYPDDADEYEDMAGKRAHFSVTINKVETVTLPELNDDFAARVTKDEDEPLTLLQLRIRIRENLQRMAEDRQNADYAREALDRMVEGASVSFPEALVSEQIDQMLRQFDQELRQRGLTLDTYMRLYNKKREDLYDEYRPTAVKTIQRSLFMRALMAHEALVIDEAAINTEIDRMVSQFGDQADQFRPFFMEGRAREGIENDLLNQKILERIASIAKGEAPELPAPANESTVSAQSDEVSEGETTS